ncbi:ferredoxin-type protein NapF [Denitratisoma sp. agr-D3]
MDIARRGFLRGQRPGSARPQPRPPWSVTEADFLRRCNRCDECIAHCPQGILLKGDGGFPTVNFAAAGCTFCGDCLRSCTSGALIDQGAAPWTWHAVMGEACLARQQVVCRSCGEACDAGAIHFPPRLGGVAQPVLDIALCTGCGACVAPCPSQAISLIPPVSEAQP